MPPDSLSRFMEAAVRAVATRFFVEPEPDFTTLGLFLTFLAFMLEPYKASYFIAFINAIKERESTKESISSGTNPWVKAYSLS